MAKNEEPGKLRAVMFELEYMALEGRKVVYSVLKRLLADKDAEMTPVLFRRYCLRATPENYLPALLEALDKKRLSVAKLAQEVNEEIRAAFDDTKIKVSPALTAVLEKTQENGARIGALTCLEEGTASLHMARLGLKDEAALLSCQPPGDKEFPTADTWLKLSKKLGVPRALCTVITTCSASSRAALSAGMRSVAFPDEFTCFENFAGADLVVEKFDGDAMKAILSLVSSVNKR